MPNLHLEMCEDLSFEKYNILLWLMFRDSAKTTLAKIAVIHSICYGYKHFIPWASFDARKAESNLFDIARELQMNGRLIEDFGQLFFDDKMNVEKFSKKKSMSEFITSNNIKVKAFSTGMSARGEVFGPYRPDFWVIDDIENMKTVISASRTSQVITFLDELFGGIAGDADLLILANKLSYTGSIAHLIEKLKKIPRAKIMDVPVYDDDNVMAWPSRFVFTDREATEINSKIEDKHEWVISLESKKQLLGETIFNREMLNRPLTEDEREFKWEWLQKTFKLADLENKVVNTYALIDVANTKDRKDLQKKGDPDYTGIIVLAVDVFNNWYILYAKRERLNAPEKIDRIFWLWDTYHPSRIGVEKVAFEDEIEPYIKIKSEELGVYPIVVQLQHHGVNKEERIRGALQGRFQHNKILFLADAKDHTDLVKQELYDFPKAKHDDLSDALAYGQQLAVRPIVQGNTQVMTDVEVEFFTARGIGRNQLAKKILRL
jgi:phage terminase large subunit-like protein